MQLIDFLRAVDPQISGQNTKIHLATWNGREDPMDEYRAGRFEEWQRWQSKRNFPRPIVISLIDYERPSRWLYAGTYDIGQCEWRKEDNCYRYESTLRQAAAEFVGRLVVTYERDGRQPYRNLDTCQDLLRVSHILPEPLSIGDFPGFKAIDLSKQELDSVVRLNSASWRSALSSVSGIYLISDPGAGRLYVGKADGQGGIWQRWCEYSNSGHGGNVEMHALLREDPQAKQRLRFSILEITDLNATQEEVLLRESHWKNILLTCSHGLNRN